MRTQNITESEMKGEKGVHEENKKEQSEKEETMKPGRKGKSAATNAAGRPSKIREDH